MRRRGSRYPGSEHRGQRHEGGLPAEAVERAVLADATGDATGGDVSARLAEASTESVPISSLQAGDFVRVAVGQAFPADGLLVRGQTRVPSIGNTHAASASRGCTTRGKPMSPTRFGIARPIRTHVSEGRSRR